MYIFRHTRTHARTHARSRVLRNGHRIRGNTRVPDAIARNPAVRIVKKGYHPLPGSRTPSSAASSRRWRGPRSARRPRSHRRPRGRCQSPAHGACSARCVRRSPPPLAHEDGSNCFRRRMTKEGDVEAGGAAHSAAAEWPQNNQARGTLRLCTGTKGTVPCRGRDNVGPSSGRRRQGDPFPRPPASPSRAPPPAALLTPATAPSAFDTPTTAESRIFDALRLNRDVAALPCAHCA